MADPTNLDYEKNTQFILTVSVTDNHEKDPLESSAKVQINLTDENEFAPAIEPQTFTLDENPLKGQEIGIIVAEDEDSHQSLIYILQDSESSVFFEINASTGSLSVKDSSIFDFKTAQAIVKININDILEITDGLLAYFPFNENALDESGNNIVSEVVGPVLTDDRFGNPNSAFEFNGVDDFITLNDNNSVITTKSFTISLWAKIYGASPVGLWGNAFFKQRDNVQGASTAKSTLYFRGDYNGNVLLHTRSSSDETIQDLKCDYAVDGNWHHYVAKIDENKTMEIYIDGFLFCSGVFPNDGDFNTSIDHINLRCHHPDGVLRAGLYGKMDEVYIHNRALNSEEILGLFSADAK